jgi:hypothetical protein
VAGRSTPPGEPGGRRRTPAPRLGRLRAGQLRPRRSDLRARRGGRARTG